MAGLFLVNCLDVARSLGSDFSKATPSSVCQFFLDDYLKPRGGGGFNHDPAIGATARVFEGSMSASEAIHYCRTNGNPSGREQNAEVLELVGPYAEREISTVYRHGFLAVVVGRHKGQSIHVGLKAPFTRVRHDEAFVVVPGFRKTFAPTEQQLTLPCSLAADQFARGDYRSADVEYLYAGSAPTGSKRMFKVIRGAKRELLSTDQLDDIFDIYVKGVVMALERGQGLQRPDLAGYRVVDPDQPSMF